MKGFSAMPKLVYGATSGITVPAGRYLAKFVGTEDAEPMKDSRFGNADQPRMAWVFEVMDGPKKGERFAQETGVKATPRSTCARIIAGLSGGNLAVGQAVDTDKFIGQLYEVKVAPNPNSDKGNLHIADLEPRGAAAGGGGGAPPPRSTGAPPRPRTNVNTKFWIDTGDGNETQGDSEAVRALIFSKGLKASELMVCPDGGSEWKPATAFGFEDSPIPA